MCCSLLSPQLFMWLSFYMSQSKCSRLYLSDGFEYFTALHAYFYDNFFLLLLYLLPRTAFNYFLFSSFYIYNTFYSFLSIASPVFNCSSSWSKHAPLGAYMHNLMCSVYCVAACVRVGCIHSRMRVLMVKVLYVTNYKARVAGFSLYLILALFSFLSVNEYKWLRVCLC